MDIDYRLRDRKQRREERKKERERERKGSIEQSKDVPTTSILYHTTILLFNSNGDREEKRYSHRT